MRISDINHRNIDMIPSHTLRLLFLQRERSRDLMIGIAFMAGALIGAVGLALLAGILP